MAVSHDSIKPKAPSPLKYWPFLLAGAIFLLTSGSASALSLRYKLEMLGYNDAEIRDILSGRVSRKEIDERFKKQMLCLPGTETPSSRTSGKDTDLEKHGRLSTSLKKTSVMSDHHWEDTQNLFFESQIDRLRTRRGAAVKPSRNTFDTTYLPEETKPFLPIIKDAAEKYAIDRHLLMAMIKVESDFEPRAISPKGAVGLMQLLPATARKLGLDDPFDPNENIHGGARYIAQCIDTFGDMKLALAAYNAGPHLIKRLKAVPPYPETRQYIRNVSYYKTLYESLSTRPLQGHSDKTAREPRDPIHGGSHNGER